MKTAAVYIAFLVTVHLNGQLSLNNDTILIREVLIKGKTGDYPASVFKYTRIDSTILHSYSHRSLAELLTQNSSIYIKSYGSGGIATPSFRGTPPGHTQIAWNNINLNNPMVGQFDMSLLPAGLIDNVEIIHGGGSLEIGSGGTGGAVNIKSGPQWGNKDALFVNPGFGSFGRYSGLIRVKTGNSVFQSVTKAFISTAENDFPFVNSLRGKEPVRENRENSQVNQRGIVQEVYLKNSKGVLSARFWYHNTLRNLPVPLSMISINTGEKQEDEAFRILTGYEYSDGSTDYNLTAAFISDKLDYTNRLASINSVNTSTRIVLKSDMIMRLNEMFRLKLIFDNEFSSISSNNYTGKKARNILSAGFSTEVSPASWLVTKLIVRETLNNEKLLAPDASFGAEFRIFRAEDQYIKVNFSRTSRIPGLNDLYWVPGGNPSLKNESAYIGELGLVIAREVSSSFRINTDLTVYKNYVKNMIQWRPGDYSYWTAGNVGKITTAGLESELNMVYLRRSFRAQTRLLYAFTRAISVNSGQNDATERDQLIYIPLNQVNLSFRLNWKNLYYNLNTSIISRRFMTVDNSQYLPGYTVSDIGFGAKLTSGNATYDLSLIIENLFDASYQNIAWYPMPGRSFSLSVIFYLKK